ncbi:MAG: hypothetical protein COV59_01750, partial [Candidatus Magasanikbacteria bacterium CG11_big_fil_rev_8_21_14_0_20_39_34]
MKERKGRNSVLYRYFFVFGFFVVTLFLGKTEVFSQELSSSTQAIASGKTEHIPDESFVTLSPTVDVADLGDKRFAYRFFRSPRVMKSTDEGMVPVGADFKLFDEIPESQLQKDKQGTGYSYSVPVEGNNLVTFFSGYYERVGVRYLKPQAADFVQEQKNGSTVTTFQDIYPHTDVEFTDSGRFRSKRIIIKEPLDYIAPESEVVFWEEVIFPEGSLLKDSDGATLKDGDEIKNKGLFIDTPHEKGIKISSAFVFDANQTEGEAQPIIQKIKVDTDAHKLSIGFTLSGRYLLDTARSYPITIDPFYTVCAGSKYEGYLGLDCIDEQLSFGRHYTENFKRYNSQFLYMGKYLNSFDERDWVAEFPVLKFDLHEIADLGDIEYAELNLRRQSDDAGTFSGCVNSVAYRINAGWNDIDANTNDILSNLDLPSPAVEFCTSNQNENWFGQNPVWLSWNVTNVVQQWLSGAPNNGLAVQIFPNWQQGAEPVWPLRHFRFYNSYTQVGSTSGGFNPYLQVNVANVDSSQLPDLQLFAPYITTDFQPRKSYGIFDDVTIVPRESIEVNAPVVNFGGNQNNAQTTLAYCVDKQEADCFVGFQRDYFIGTPALLSGDIFVDTRRTINFNDFNEGYGIYGLYADVDTYHGLAEQNEGNNREAFSINYQNAQDLYPQNFFIQNPVGTFSGQALRVSGNFFRVGNSVGTQFSYQLRLRNVDSGNIYFMDQLSPAQIDMAFVGGKQVTLQGRIPDQLPLQGYYQMQVLIDPNNTVAEAHEDNNSVFTSNIVFISRNGLCNGCSSGPVQSGVTLANYDNDTAPDVVEQTVGTKPLSPFDTIQVFSPSKSQYLAKINDFELQSYGGDPVNMRTGAFELVQKDFEIKGRGTPINFVRTYNSKLVDRNSRMGNGWHFSYNIYTYLDPTTKSVQIYLGGTLASTFTSSDNGETFQAPKGEYDELVWSQDHAYLIYRTIDGVQYFFERKVTQELSVISKIVDTNENQTTFEYNIVRDVPLLSAVQDPSGRRIVFSYGALDSEKWDKIQNITYPADGGNWNVSYDYDAEGFLRTVTRKRIFHNPQDDSLQSEDITVFYNYDPYGRMEGYVNENATTLQNTYDEQGRVLTQSQQRSIDGRTVIELLYEFEYKDEVDPNVPGSSSCTTLKSYTDDVSFYTEKTCFNADNQKIYFQDGENAQEQWTYNGDGMNSAYTDKNGNVMVYTYDQRRRLIEEKIPDTEKFSTSYLYQYENTFNRIVRKEERSTDLSLGTQISKVTLYSIDPNNGNILSMTDPEGEREDFLYDNFGNVIRHTDKNGNVIDSTYDIQGNYKIQDQRETVQADGSTQIIQSSYSYDIYGNPTSYTTPRNNQFLFGYDSDHNIRIEQDPFGNSKDSFYNPDGKLLRQEDKRGSEIVFFYSKGINNNVAKTSERGELGSEDDREVTFENDLQGNRLQVNDANGNSTRFVYDAQKRIIQRIEPYTTTTFSYDLNGNITREENSEGEITLNFYDSRDNKIETQRLISGDEYTVEQFEYDGFNRLVAQVDPKGNRKEYQYDLLDRVTLEKDALQNQFEYSYDPNGNKISVLFPRARGNASLQNSFGASVSYVYDALNRKIKEINADNKETWYFYDTENNLLKKIDRQDSNGENNTHVQMYSYDALNRLLSQTDSLGNVKNFEYDEVGNKTAFVDELGRREEFEYDRFNRNTLERDPLGNTTGYVYDKNNNKREIIYRDGTSVHYTYDAQNRLTAVQDELNGEKTFVYDGLGNKVLETDKRGYETSFSYDGLNRLIEVINAQGTTSTFFYDLNSNKIRENIDGVVTEFEYDNLNRTSQIHHPGDKLESYVYDENGNVLSMTDGNTTTIFFVYDSLNRMIEKDLGAEGVVRYDYDNWGNKISTIQERHTVSSTFDTENRELSQTQTFSELENKNSTVSKTYQPDGQLEILTDAAGRLFAYGYDSRGLLSSVGYQGNILVQYIYNEMEGVVGLTYGNGITESQGYDALNRLSEHQIIGTDQSVVWSENYTYDEESNRIGMARHDENNATYTYDELEQLTGVTYDTAFAQRTLSYRYDPRGNRLEELDPLAHQVYSYTSGTNELNQVSAGVYSLEYQYDGNGSITKETTRRLGVGTQSVNFVWDTQNRLKSQIFVDQSQPAFLPSADPVSMIYDYDDYGNRIEKKMVIHDNIEEVRYYINEGLVVLNELDELGNAAKSIVHGINEIAEIDENGDISYIHSDVLGSTVLITGAEGYVIAQYQYDPFGNVIGYGGSADTNYTFTGQEYDAETDQYYFNARYHNANNGRFFSRDTYLGNDGDILSQNRYI